MSIVAPVFKILIISDFNGADANVVRDFLFCFNRYSRHDFYYIFDPRSITESFDFKPFDVILIFWSVYLPGSRLSNAARERIRHAEALKVLFLQDEYRNVHLFNRLMSDLGVQVMFTCVAAEDHNVFYSVERIPSLQAVYRVLTGYVPSYLEAVHPFDSWDRPLDIGYRSRAVSPYLGDLGREKIVVAERFQEISKRYGFRSDISVREEDRIYGRAWINFLKSSRFTLGSASGASVVDFTGDIYRNCENYLALNPGASYDELKDRFFTEAEGKYVIDTVSPRVFESAALGCTMVFHEGFYGGVLRPGVHYICVKKDYSNIEDVVAQMKDSALTRQIAANAYHDLIASGAYSYRTFGNWFDTVLDKNVKRLSQKAISKSAFYASNYFRSGQVYLPKEDTFFVLPGRKFFDFFRILKKLEQNIRLHLPFLVMWQLLFQYFRRGIWKRISLKYLVMDLFRLSLIRSLLQGSKVIVVDFGVYPEYKPRQFMLSLVSYDLKSGMQNAKSEGFMTGFDLSQFISHLQNNQALFEWDHSPVDSHLEYEYRKKVYSIDMGLDGHYGFYALAELARYCPEWVADVLRSVIYAAEYG